MTPVEKWLERLADGDPALQQLEAYAWMEYARARFGVDTARDREMRAEFVSRCRLSFDRMYSEAKRAKTKPDFTAVTLRTLALLSLEKPCTFCGEYFGVDQLTFTYEQPDRAAAKPWRRSNVAACCSLCAVGKGDLSGGVWRDVIAALRTADTASAKAAREAIAAGRMQLGRRGRPQGTP